VTGPEEGKKNPDAAGYGKAYEIIAASIQLAAAVILMLFLGRWLDGKFGTAPWLMLAGLTVGFAAGLYAFLRSVQKLANNDQPQGKQG
jgi:ATP synthase protein I